MEKIIVFGTGSVANLLMEELDLEKVEILAFVNSNASVDEFWNYPVIRPESIIKVPFDYIIIASGYYMEMRRILLQLGIAHEKIVGFIFDETEFYKEINAQIQNHLELELHRSALRRWTKSGKLFPDASVSVFWKNHIPKHTGKDFVREYTLMLVAKEIERRNVKGSVVELGVFKGDFTVMIDKAFPKRKLYLFDTFCGFPQDALEHDSTVKDRVNEALKFKNTSESYVLSRLPNHKENCIVKKGVFPQTFDLWEETFCFVSVDLNLNEPVKKSLELFYPRLEKGGYFMISDFNAPFYEGSREAVIEFCDAKQIAYMPIPDLYGSIMIIK